MKFKSNFKQRNNSIQGLRSFKDTLPTKIKRIIAKKGEIYSKTLDNWKYLVGKDLFKICYPKSYNKSRLKGKILNIMVEHGHEVDLDYSRQIIIDKINYFFGHNVVDNIKLKVFYKTHDKDIFRDTNNATKNKYKKRISGVKNLQIRDSLNELNKVFKYK